MLASCGKYYHDPQLFLNARAKSGKWAVMCKCVVEVSIRLFLRFFCFYILALFPQCGIFFLICIQWIWVFFQRVRLQHYRNNISQYIPRSYSTDTCVSILYEWVSEWVGYCWKSNENFVLLYRNLLFNIIGNYCSNFLNMSDLSKLKYILNPNPDLSSDICTFIKQSLELR